jgi:hypothetical protein
MVLLEMKASTMTISPKFWLALLISVVLHGIGIGLFCRLSTENQAQVAQSDLLEFVPSQEDPTLTTFVMGQTEVLNLSGQSKPTLPAPKPSNVAEAASGKEPKPLPQSVKAQATPIDNSAGSPGMKGSANARGGSTATTFFDVPAKGQKIVYLIDHSASMGPSGALDVAGQELLASLDRLPLGTCFQIIVYNRSANLLMPRYPDWIPVQADVIRQVAAAWNSLPAEGGTDHIRALKLALTLRADVIFFLTDAVDVRANELRDISRLNQGRCAIHTIQLHSNQQNCDDGPLKLLARENRGTFQSVRVR